jgi:hypothetical protein
VDFSWYFGFSTNKIDRPDITEILLKVRLNNLTLILTFQLHTLLGVPLKESNENTTFFVYNLYLIPFFRQLGQITAWPLEQTHAEVQDKMVVSLLVLLLVL